jgi:FixJ family two-component response regulator
MTGAATVFVVDDDERVRDSLRWLLESVGLNVETYASAREFLTAFDPPRPGCLVLDARMPEMSGLELLDELTARGVRLPAILITGHGDVQMTVRAMLAGAVDVIEKPLDDKRLLERIRQCLAACVRAPDDGAGAG